LLEQPAGDIRALRRIGSMIETPRFHPYLTARETLIMLATQSGVASPDVDGWLGRVGIAEAADRRTKGFSVGMKQRLGIAAALITRPEAVILDEPTSGMDPVGARQIKDLIAELARRGKTVLLCTHQLSDVEDLCDRVAIMFGGRVRAEGTCDELLVREDRTTIATEALPAAVVEEVRGVLGRHGIVAVDVERPRRRLESLFLEIVEQARAEGTRTSGATSGGPIAEFLTEPAGTPAAADGANAPEAATAPVDSALIDRLTNR
jgi:ABC-2 type transport system ATP-binding protein